MTLKKRLLHTRTRLPKENLILEIMGCRIADNMSGELEQALNRYRQKKQEERGLAEQQEAVQKIAEQEKMASINRDFERVIIPVFKRLSESVPELVDLFNTFAQQVAKKVGLKELLPQRSYLIYDRDGNLLYEEPTRILDVSRHPEVTTKEKERVLQAINEAGMENLEILTHYRCPGECKFTTPYFGFEVTSKNPSVVHWWTGGGDAGKISGDYIRTQESLESVAGGLARALEEGIFEYEFPSPPQEHYSGSD